MAQCKLSNCREEAVQGGKRYCAHHMAEYKRKQREYLEVQKTLPNCICCGEKLTKTAHDGGQTTCSDCIAKKEVLDRQLKRQARIEAAFAEKMQALDDAGSVDDLKSWIKRYMTSNT